MEHDFKQEGTEILLWELGDDAPRLPKQELKEICVTGFSYCSEDPCYSVRLFGNRKCRCIREKFKNRNDFLLYEKGRAFYLEQLTIRLFKVGVFGEINENLDRGKHSNG